MEQSNNWSYEWVYELDMRVLTLSGEYFIIYSGERVFSLLEWQITRPEVLLEEHLGETRRLPEKHKFILLKTSRGDNVLNAIEILQNYAYTYRAEKENATN